MLRIACLLAVTSASALAHPARAQESSAQASARAKFEEGVALMGQSRYAEACTKLEASLADYPGLGTRGKLAECFEKAGRLASAWATYRQVAKLAGAAGDATRERIAFDRAVALEPRLAYLTVVAPASDVPGLVVKRNGESVAQLGTAEPVDAGLVQIEASAPGRRPFTTRIMASQGQTSKLALPVLDPLTATPTTTTTMDGRARTEPARSASASASAPAPEAGREARSWQRPLGLGLGGAGLVTAVIGGVVGLAAKSTYDGAFDRGACDVSTKRCDAAGQEDTESARSTAGAATILVGAGFALAAAGVVLYLTAPTSRATALHLSPTLGVGQGGLALGGRL